MHCDTIGGTLYSADYPFFLQETLRSKFGKHFISGFGAGTCGDINNIDVHNPNPFKGFPNAEYLGTNLGKTVLDATPHLRSITNPSFKVLSAKIDVPLMKPTAEQLADAHTKIDKLGDPNTDFFVKVIAVKILDLEHKANPYTMEVQVFRFDADTALVCLPCEIFVDLGLAIKQASPFKNTIVQSICNDRPSYVPTKKAFTEGSYEISNARVASGAGEMLVDTAVKLLNEAKK
jgi:neutral ceramidase